MQQEHTLVNGCSDYFFYMRFASKELANTFLALCKKVDLGTIYPNAGYANVETTDVVRNNTTLVTAEMLDKLEKKVERVFDYDEFAGSDAVTEFEIEVGFEDEKDENNYR